MQRNEIAAGVVACLSDQEKLSLRLVNNDARQFVKAGMQAPYTTKAQFVCALTGQYIFGQYNCLNCTADMIRVVRLTNYRLMTAWDEYNKTIISQSKLPAMLYKIKHLSTIALLFTFTKFQKKEDLRDEGRKYAPNFHNWAINQAWVLAQIHKGRRFILFSPVTDDTVFRQPSHQKRANDYSAFAREIAALMKAGYHLFANDSYQLELRPSQQMDLTSITFDDISADDDEVKEAVKSTQEFSLQNQIIDYNSINKIAVIGKPYATI